MKHIIEAIFRIILLAIILTIWWLILNTPFSKVMNLSVITGGLMLTYPLVWLGRKILDRHQSAGHAMWTTTFVHFGLAFTFGVPVVRALATQQAWPGWVLPVPSVIGQFLIIITGTATFLTVANLALKGFGAPFLSASAGNWRPTGCTPGHAIPWFWQLYLCCSRWESGFNPCCLSCGFSYCLPRHCFFCESVRRKRT